MTPRRIEFRIAVLRAGRTTQDVARELKVSHNDLILVLDGGRKGSARLKEAIARILGLSGED